MQYQIEFLDDANSIVRVMHAEARSRGTALLLVVENDWPPDALTACVVDRHGRRGPSVSKPQAKSRPKVTLSTDSVAEIAAKAAGLMAIRALGRLCPIRRCAALGSSPTGHPGTGQLAPYRCSLALRS